MSIYETAKLSASPAPIGCMKVLTVRQPWASLLMLGIKRFETRSWSTKFRGMVMLHASKTVFRNDDVKRIVDESILPNDTVDRDRLVSFMHGLAKHTPGTVIGAMQIEDSVRTEKITVPKSEMIMGDWSPGRYAWQMTPLFELTFPIEAKGALGLWNWRAPQGIHRITGRFPHGDGKFMDVVAWQPPGPPISSVIKQLTQPAQLTETGEA